MGKRQLLAWAVAAGVAAIALLLLVPTLAWPPSGEPPSAGAGSPTGDADTAPASASRVGAARHEGAPGPGRGDHPAELPGSLRGTDVVGGFVVGEDGHLRPTPDALALFDYYLAASGEEPLASLRARIVDAIHARLDGVAADEAVALLDDYLGLRAELRALAEAGEPPHDLERRLQWIRELRRERLGPETADALFGREEATMAVDLERRRIALDDSIDEATRTERLAALEAELPEDVRAARARARAPARTHERVEALRDAGASEAEIFAVRAEQFGAEAAERLAALDARQAEWNARLEAFRRERAEIESAEAGLAPEEVDGELEALLHAHFDEHELRRVRMIEALHARADSIGRGAAAP
jgi:lipase chaperone LimK